ncbi:sarcosine oxidase subunit gamma family protein [Rhizobium sp. 9140]|uniref:sarcosine oxidase subunit gamma family protein n=1 Tax=Rhizobium sp. 9140 TaxID=1761900 RepID=UPI000795A616|nr:sarcosine oxidase subunit gamma family protein [Rhizobium sp. 9140]CZT37429.1 N-methylglutamate dehydrogenase subunit D [Rhizobium sp. 9140]
MSDFHITPYITTSAALKGCTRLVSRAIRLEALPEGHVIQVLGKPGDTLSMARLKAISDGAPHAVRAAGLGQWFIVGDRAKTHAELADLFASLQPEAFGVDQSAGRVRILAAGPMVERMLAKGTAVDLSLSNVPVGHATTALIGHIAAHITRTGNDTFEIMVLRGFAQSLWDDLARMSAEFLDS